MDNSTTTEMMIDEDGIDAADVDAEDEALASEPSTMLLTLLGLVIITLMFGLGSTLDYETTVKSTLKHKLPPCIGIICQYIIMPLIAFCFAKGFHFSTAKSIGLLICGIVPGGSSSNLFVYYLNGDVSLSIFMTVLSNLLAIGMIPLLLWIYGTNLIQQSQEDDEEDEVDGTASTSTAANNIPYTNLVLSLLLILIPVICGIYLRSKSVLWAKRVEKVGSVIGIMFIMVSLTIGIMDNLILFQKEITSWQTWITSAMLSILGFFTSYGIARLVFQLSYSTSLTIGLEVGIQNTIIAVTITILIYNDNGITTTLNEALIFPLMCSFWDIANSILISIVILGPKMYGRLVGTHKDSSTTIEDGNKEDNEQPPPQATEGQKDFVVSVGANDNDREDEDDEERK